MLPIEYKNRYTGAHMIETSGHSISCMNSSAKKDSRIDNLFGNLSLERRNRKTKTTLNDSPFFLAFATTMLRAFAHIRSLSVDLRKKFIIRTDKKDTSSEKTSFYLSNMHQSIFFDCYPINDERRTNRKKRSEDVGRK